MNIEQLTVGLRVKSNREFSGVPAGTIGEVVEEKNSWPIAGAESVAIAWRRFEGDKLIDWFSFDELEFLDAVYRDEFGHQLLGGMPVHQTVNPRDKLCVLCGEHV